MHHGCREGPVLEKPLVAIAHLFLRIVELARPDEYIHECRDPGRQHTAIHLPWSDSPTKPLEGLKGPRHGVNGGLLTAGLPKPQPAGIHEHVIGRQPTFRSTDTHRLVANRGSTPRKDKLNDWGGRECNIFIPVLRGKGTKIAPTGDRFDQLP